VLAVPKSIAISCDHIDDKPDKPLKNILTFLCLSVQIFIWRSFCSFDY
jgi:hypothetical protein